MAIIEDFFISKFPYNGAVYTFVVDEDAPLDEREPEEVTVQEMKCDIQRQGARRNGVFLGAGYTVYYPLDPNPDWDGNDMATKYMPIKVKRGMTFKGNDSLYHIEGEIEFVRFSQLGQASFDVKVSTESDLNISEDGK